MAIPVGAWAVGVGRDRTDGLDSEHETVSAPNTVAPDPARAHPPARSGKRSVIGFFPDMADDQGGELHVRGERAAASGRPGR